MGAEQGVLIAGAGEPAVERPAESSAVVAAATPAPTPRPRWKPVDRQQTCLQVVDTEALVEKDHPVRALWHLLGELDLSAFAVGVKAVEGRPGRDGSDPRVLIALWLYALSRGVREARALDEWSKYEPGCRWLLGLGHINYHTLSDFVTAQGAALDALFVELVQVLMQQGLVKLERVAHDGTKIQAQASRGSFKRQATLAACREKAAAHLAALDEGRAKEARVAQRQAQRRAAQEYGERLRAAEEELKRLQAEKPAAEQAEVRVSLSDPEARNMRQADGGFAPSYNAQISTDSVADVIVAYAATQAQEDSHELAAALERLEDNTGRAPQQVLVDGGYTTRQNILETASANTELIGSLGEDRSQSKQRRQGVSPAFFSEHFVFEAERSHYQCPAGKILTYKSRKKIVGATEKQYRAPASECQACRFRRQCCPKTSPRGRLVVRTEEDPAVAAFRQKMQQPEYRALYRQRAQVAEFANACLKEKRGLRKFLRRGLQKVCAELAWACLACNVAVWIRRVWKVGLQPAT